MRLIQNAILVTILNINSTSEHEFLYAFLMNANSKACLRPHPQPTPPPALTSTDRSDERLAPLIEVSHSEKAHSVRLIYRLKLGFFWYF